MFDMIINRLWLRGIYFFLAGASVSEALSLCSSGSEKSFSTVDVFAKANYWYTSESIDWAYTSEGNSNDWTSSYQMFVFDWAPGFTVGLGCAMEHDRWDSNISYTWFQSKALAHAGGGDVSITPGFLAHRLAPYLPFIGPFSTGKASIDIHYNMFDWDLGRPFFIDKNFLIRPAIGLKGGWINQWIRSSWTLPALTDFLANENLTQKFQAGGAKAGVTGKWCLSTRLKQTFSLVGMFDLAYLWGHWSIRNQFLDTFAITINLETTDRNFGVLVFHSFLGFEWEFLLRQNRNHVAFKLGYEIEDWLDQCQFFTNISGSQSNDLILQGLSGSFCIAF